MCFFAENGKFFRVFGSNTLVDTTIRRKLKQEYTDYIKLVTSKPKANRIQAFLQFKANKEVFFDIVRDKEAMDADETVFFF